MWKNEHTALIRAKAPKLTNPDDVKDNFCHKIDSLISGIPMGDNLVILGDFNPRVGADHQTWTEQLVERRSINEVIILGTYITYDPLITNATTV